MIFIAKECQMDVKAARVIKETTGMRIEIKEGGREGECL